MDMKKYDDPLSMGFLYVRKEHINPRVLDEIKNNLIFREKDYFTDEWKEIIYYYEEAGIVILPKFYQMVYGDLNIKPRNYFTEGKSIEIENTIEPRDAEQSKIINHFTDESDVGIVKAYTGFGKTYVFVKIMSNIKKKTLIIVDKKKLANQWIKDITDFTDMDKDDIAVLSGRESVTTKNLDKPVCIALIQTLSSIANESLLLDNKYLKMFIDANYGLMGLDEVHKTGATPHFSKAALFFISKKLIGLSATPRKNNEKANNVLYSYFANSIISPDESGQLRVTYNTIYFNSGISYKTHNWINFGGKYNYSRYRKKLLESEAYQNLFLTLMKLLISQNKKIILVAHEIKTLENLKQYLINQEVLQSYEIGIAISGSDPKDLKKDYVFSTYGTMTAGLSLNHMNTLILLTTPGADGSTIEQIKGRITRDHTDKNAKPMMYDLVDKYNTKIESKINKRISEYDRLKMIKGDSFDFDGYDKLIERKQI